MRRRTRAPDHRHGTIVAVAEGAGLAPTGDTGREQLPDICALLLGNWCKSRQALVAACFETCDVPDRKDVWMTRHRTIGPDRYSPVADPIDSKPFSSRTGLSAGTSQHGSGIYPLATEHHAGGIDCLDGRANPHLHPHRG